MYTFGCFFEEYPSHVYQQMVLSQAQVQAQSNAEYHGFNLFIATTYIPSFRDMLARPIEAGASCSREVAFSG